VLTLFRNEDVVVVVFVVEALVVVTLVGSFSVDEILELGELLLLVLIITVEPFFDFPLATSK
jgi:hypothetical protein